MPDLPDSQQAIVVVIEDDASMRESLRVLLDTAGYQSISYGCAEDYLQIDPPIIPGCLLIDLHLPGMDGLELQQHLSSHQPGVPMIFLSGDASAHDIEQAMAGGALEFLRKPFDGERLLRITARCLSHSAQQGRRRDS